MEIWFSIIHRGQQCEEVLFPSVRPRSPRCPHKLLPDECWICTGHRPSRDHDDLIFNASAVGLGQVPWNLAKSIIRDLYGIEDLDEEQK